jgi:hypothetical protein
VLRLAPRFAVVLVVRLERHVGLFDHHLDLAEAERVVVVGDSGVVPSQSREGVFQQAQQRGETLCLQLAHVRVFFDRLLPLYAFQAESFFDGLEGFESDGNALVASTSPIPDMRGAPSGEVGDAVEVAGAREVVSQAGGGSAQSLLRSFSCRCAGRRRAGRSRGL